jgi:hypothetical protein
MLHILNLNLNYFLKVVCGCGCGCDCECLIMLDFPFYYIRCAVAKLGAAAASILSQILELQVFF